MVSRNSEGEWAWDGSCGMQQGMKSLSNRSVVLRGEGSNHAGESLGRIGATRVSARCETPRAITAGRGASSSVDFMHARQINPC